MVLPLGVDDLQHDVALDAPQDLDRNQLLFGLVLLEDRRPERVGHFLGAHALEVLRLEVRRIDPVNLADRLDEPAQVALLGVDFRAGVRVDRAVEQLLGERHQILAAVDRFLVRDVDLPLEQLPPQRVDAFALLVHDVVVLEEVLADGEVLRLDLLLRALDRLGHHLVLDGDALFHAEALHQPGDAIRPEDPHQVVFERQVEPGRSGIALAAGAAAELVVDAARLVALGRDDVEAADRDDLVVLGVGLPLQRREDPLVRRARHAIEVVEVEEVDELLVVDELLLALRQPLGDLLGQRLLPRHELGVAAEQDVGAAAGHVGRDRDRVLAPGLGDNLRFLRVVLRVEDDVLDAAELQLLGEPLGLLDRDRADEHRPSLLLFLDDVGDDRLELLALRAVDRVGLFDAAQQAVGRRDHDVELVDLVELVRFGVRRAGHAAQLRVLAEVVLEGDGGERLVLPLDLDLLLRLHRLVETVAPAPARHQAARELVHDHDAAVLDHVVDVELEDGVRLQGLVDVVEERHVRRVVEAAGEQPVRQHLLGLRHAALGQRDGLVLLVDEEVAGLLELVAILRLDVALRHGARGQLRHDPIDFVVEVGRFLRRPGDDERGPGLVDEDAVDLVHDREVVPALHVVREVELHVVAEVVEAELVVRAVGDVGGVGDLALLIVQIVLDDPDRHAEEPVEAAHPFGVAARQIVVDRDDVDAFAVERIEIGGQRGDERLAFAGLHLGDLPAVQHDAADELHVEVAHFQHAAARLADDRERFREHFVERFAVAKPLAELRRLSTEPLVGERLDLRFFRADFGDHRTQALQVTLVLRADDLREESVNNHQGRIGSGYQLIVQGSGEKGKRPARCARR